MVSKVAVIALVAIVACPILLGYALNLEETTYTDYREKDGTAVNVTDLLQSGTGYSYAHADTYAMNTKFTNHGSPAFPVYDAFTTAATSFPVEVAIHKNSNYAPTTTHIFSDYAFYYFVASYDMPGGGGYLTGTFTYNDNTTQSVTRIHSIYYDNSSGNVQYVRYNGDGTVIGNAITIQNVKTISYSKTTPYLADTMRIDKPALGNQNVDLSGGFYLNQFEIAGANAITSLNMPSDSRNLLMTFDLGTISDSSYEYSIIVGGKIIRMVKTTDSEGVHWAAYWNVSGDTSKIADLYYDSNRLSNAYQIYLDLEGVELRYVGSWPSFFGAAQSYFTYEADWTTSGAALDLNDVSLLNKTPLMRIDDAEYKAFEYPVIENLTYKPSDFRAQPSTTISNANLYGTSIVFGGNTYTVKNGNITIGTHQIPVKGMKLDSIPDTVNGGYKNRINGTVISTTLTPSDITFNGQWGIVVSTMSTESYTYTKTEWTPGNFAWNGIDDNFLVVGLLTSIGAFIALGIYARRTNARVLPLLIVCGGAAVLFFTMM